MYAVTLFMSRMDYWKFLEANIQMQTKMLIVTQQSDYRFFFFFIVFAHTFTEREDETNVLTQKFIHQWNDAQPNIFIQCNYTLGIQYSYRWMHFHSHDLNIQKQNKKRMFNVRSINNLVKRDIDYSSIHLLTANPVDDILFLLFIRISGLLPLKLHTRWIVVVYRIWSQYI